MRRRFRLRPSQSNALRIQHRVYEELVMCVPSLSGPVLSVHKQVRIEGGLCIASLQVDDIPTYSTFPSQIVDMLGRHPLSTSARRGKNHSGGYNEK